MENKLDQIVNRLRSAGGDNLKSIVLYGSAVTGEFSTKHSDLNLLCVVENAGTAELEKLHPAAEWWVKEGHPAPLVFTLEELNHAADMFAIELLDIRAHRRVLYGLDVFETFEVPTWLHRLQVERELHVNWVRLRQAILAAPRKNKVLLGIMVDSVSSFATLFKHALLAAGEQAPATKREAVERASVMVGADPAPFLAVLDLREGKGKSRRIDVEEAIHGYLELVELFTKEVDRRFAPQR
ncbi:MAG: nucleotidyltransferase domain-containing protein [Candidatus Acidiferrales bacterium]